jgi:acetyl-CoA C-acetyltransferase
MHGSPRNKPEIYWNMLQTAENVAKRYRIPKERMDEYGVGSQQRACAAKEAGLFDAEIAPITVTAGVADKVLGMRSKEVTVSADEGLRPGTTMDAIRGIRSAVPGGVITAGNASQVSDGAGACVVVSETYAQAKRFASAGKISGLCNRRLRTRRNGYRAGSLPSRRS